VLAKHWPEVPCYHDVRELTAERLAADDIIPDVICGGFPCQDLSSAASNRAEGIDGERSGLWSEIKRLAREVRPQFVIVENVPNLLAGDRGAWFGSVLGDLAEIGFDAEWHCIPAAGVGAPHIRDRVWVVAYPASERPRQLWWGERAAACAAQWDLHWTGPEPGIERVADGVPDRVERLTALGNTLTPQIPQLIGHAILQLSN
jgi:DNA (cytosine-5)-methyltransferase 1